MTETCACGSVQDAYDITSGRVGPPLGSAIVKLVDWPEGNYFVKNDPPQGKFDISNIILPNKLFDSEFQVKSVLVDPLLLQGIGKCPIRQLKIILKKME